MTVGVQNVGKQIRDIRVVINDKNGQGPRLDDRLCPRSINRWQGVRDRQLNDETRTAGGRFIKSDLPVMDLDNPVT